MKIEDSWFRAKTCLWVINFLSDSFSLNTYLKGVLYLSKQVEPSF